MSHIKYVQVDHEESQRVLEDIKNGRGLKPMPEPAVYYDRPESMYPDKIRLSFPDGHTEIYDRRIKQPSPRRYLNMPRHQRKGK